jgi:membrane protease YdiL (CAAX protease family)
MSNQLSSFKKAGLFYLITFVLAMSVALFGQGLGVSSLYIYMFTPLAAVLIMLLIVTRDGYTRAGWQTLGLHRLGWQKWGLAVFGPLLVMSCTYIITWSTGIGRFDLSGLSTSGGLLSVFLGLTLTLVFAFGEEIGWRGYLLPQLLPLGRTKSLLLHGLLHAIFHLPAILLTPFYHGTGDRLIVTILFLLTVTLGAVFYGYLRLSSDSVWPSVVAHGTFNWIWGWFTLVTVAVSSPVVLEYLAGESGVLTLIGVTLVAGWLLYRWPRQTVPAQSAKATVGGL